MKKFTIILIHYNQMKYIQVALKSILNQSYKNIEVIIADDCSKEFDASKVEKYIKENNKNRFSYKILQNKKNLGTVKNLNHALKKVSGEYVLFFAADDKLSNSKVIERFVHEFENTNKNIITAQCGLYDKKLKNKFNDFVNKKKALKLNRKTSNAIYEKMCEGCFYGAGSTAYRKSIFENYGFFNERYQYVEDWSYWLYVLRNGEKIYYADFEALCHRDGGISHSTYTQETIPQHVRQYYKDILNIYENEVIPYLELFSTKEKYRILRQYNETILYYSCFVPTLTSYLKSFDEARNMDKKIKYYWKLQTLNKIINVHPIQKIKALIHYNRVVPITVIIWLLCCFLIINRMYITNNYKLLTIYILVYIVLYYIVYVIDKLEYYLKIYFSNKKNSK